MEIPFDDWKEQYKPRIYEDSGAECYDHDECDCEFLYTVELSELEDEDANAVEEKRIWSWGVGGEIVSGVVNPRWDLLITEIPYAEDTRVI